MIGGVVSPGAGGDPAAQRRELEALRIMAQGETVGAKLRLQSWPVGPGLDTRRAGHAVHFQHLVQCRKVYGDDAVVALGRLEPGHGGAAPAVGYGGVAVGGAPVQHRRNFVLGSGMSHHVGWVGELEVVGADAVAEATPVGMHRAVVVAGGADGGQGSGRADTWGPQPQVFGPGRRYRLYRHTVALRQPRRRFTYLLLRGFVLLQPPGPETSAAHATLLLSA